MDNLFVTLFFGSKSTFISYSVAVISVFRSGVWFGSIAMVGYFVHHYRSSFINDHYNRRTDKTRLWYISFYEDGTRKILRYQRGNKKT